MEISKSEFKGNFNIVSLMIFQNRNLKEPSKSNFKKEIRNLEFKGHINIEFKGHFQIRI